MRLIDADHILEAKRAADKGGLRLAPMFFFFKDDEVPYVSAVPPGWGNGLEQIFALTQAITTARYDDADFVLLVTEIDLTPVDKDDELFAVPGLLTMEVDVKEKSSDITAFRVTRDDAGEIGLVPARTTFAMEKLDIVEMACSDPILPLPYALRSEAVWRSLSANGWRIMGMAQHGDEIGALWLFV